MQKSLENITFRQLKSDPNQYLDTVSPDYQRRLGSIETKVRRLTGQSIADARFKKLPGDTAGQFNTRTEAVDFDVQTLSDLDTLEQVATHEEKHKKNKHNNGTLRVVSRAVDEG